MIQMCTIITTQLTVDLNLLPFHSKKNISKTPNSPQFLSIHLDIYSISILPLLNLCPFSFEKKQLPQNREKAVAKRQGDIPLPVFAPSVVVGKRSTWKSSNSPSRKPFYVGEKAGGRWRYPMTLNVWRFYPQKPWNGTRKNLILTPF